MLSSNIETLHCAQIDITYNARKKIYANGCSEIMVASRDIFREKGWELSDDEAALRRVSARKKDDGTAAGSDRARRRAAAAVRDLVLCNDFRYFVTLTLNREKIDRYDMGEVVKRLNIWLDNRVRRNGLKYVIVPELHKDGAIHFHGFFNDALEVISSGTFSVPGSKKPRRPRSEKERERWLDNGAHEVFNLPDWSFGFSTAIEIYGNYEAATAYICKYVRKQDTKVGGRWYYSGGRLQKPEIVLFNADYYAYAEEGYCFSVPEAGLSICRVMLYPEKSD